LVALRPTEPSAEWYAVFQEKVGSLASDVQRAQSFTNVARIVGEPLAEERLSHSSAGIGKQSVGRRERR
jgi:hypothetical protein